MIEWRRHPRIREEINVLWTMPSESLHGQGIVRNISISGLLLEVDDQFKPVDNALFNLEVIGQSQNFIPRNVKFVWFSRNAADRRRTLCGVTFVDPTGPTYMRLKEHIDSRLENVLQATNLNIMNRYLYQSN